MESDQVPDVPMETDLPAPAESSHLGNQGSYMYSKQVYFVDICRNIYMYIYLL